MAALIPTRLNQSATEYTTVDDFDLANDLIPIGSAGNDGKLAKSTISLLSDAIADNILANASKIDLEFFVSEYAEPGESVVFSGEDWATTQPSQEQRRKNWRIFMEACLKANGGSGAANGGGWYVTNEVLQRSYGGEVFIKGPLIIEPYADSEYAPFFSTADTTQKGATTRGWTIPGGVAISGNGGTSGYADTIGNPGHGASRLIGYGAPAIQAYGGAGPVMLGVGRHVCGWKLKGIGLARIGDTALASVANPVLRAANFYDTSYSAITGLCIDYTVDDVVIDLDPDSSYPQVGALFQAGQNSNVPRLAIYGNGNSGWCQVVSGTFNGTAKVSPTTTLFFGDIIGWGSKRGMVWTYANLFANTINMEPASFTSSKQQLIIGDQVDSTVIDFLWMENCIQPDVATASGADQGLCVIGGIDSEWNPNYSVGTYSKPGPAVIKNALMGGNNSDNPDYAFIWKSCADFQLGGLVAAYFDVAIHRIDPGTVSVADDPTYIRGSYDSSKTQWSNAPAFVSDATDYAYNGYAYPSGVVDRALVGGSMAATKPNRSVAQGNTAVRGEKVFNTAPVAGGPVGWVCTTAGAYPTAVFTPFGLSYLEGSATFNPSNLADGDGETTTVTVTGAALGDYAMASFSLDLQGISVTAYVSSANTVSVRFQNESGGPLDINSGTLRARVFKA